ncbi:MAG: reductive dehalogenase domain-containing protein [Pseudomonadota bacterium]
MRLFSYKNRPVHLGPYPLERLPRQDTQPELTVSPPMVDLEGPAPAGMAPAILDALTVLDAIRDGTVNAARSEIPSDPVERANHLKAAGYYFDASQAGTCRLRTDVFLERPRRNSRLDDLARHLQTAQPNTLAAGIDVVMADVRDSAASTPGPCRHHSHAIVYLTEHPRDPDPGEPGGGWIAGTNDHRSAVRAAETAVVLANYLRILGVDARAHTATSSDVDLNRLAVLAGLAELRGDDRDVDLVNPYCGTDFALAAITMSLEIAVDRPLARASLGERWRSHGPAWWVGKGTSKAAFNRKPYARRNFSQGAFPFETIKRRDTPTTLVDEPRIPRVPKRTDMFARALFGDMGPAMQDAARNGNYLLKNPMGYCSRRALGALILMQDGPAAETVDPGTADPAKNADDVKAALYFLGADAVGLSRCPDWAYYSHDARGDPLEPYHENAISILIDQGHETMEGASGDDWISGAQSMRAYLRTSLIGGIVAAHIRSLGYTARVHSVLDGEVLQPPLLLLSGLGEVSRIGEVILNPFLGPRLKSGVVTTNMPLAHDRPIDFGLQNFCENCNKCARECPSGAITAGPKLMFNGYEIWKSDSERCARYRIAQTAGSMCGRCMKTCPWNLEGLFKEAPFRWAASHIPQAARFLAELDDRVGNGRVNPVKKWWWDLERRPDGGYGPADQTNSRGLQTDLDLKYEDQALAVYPAPLAPHPWPFPFPMDREKGLAAYKSLVSPVIYRRKMEAGEADGIAHVYRIPEGESPVLPVTLVEADPLTDDTVRYAFAAPDGRELPPFEAGAHIDVVVAPEFFRQYSLAGDPADHGRYVIGVLREDEGRGGSALMHRIFRKGRRVFISRPINHFPLEEDASKTLLFGGGIGVTPLIAMAHRLHALDRDFRLFYSCKTRASAAFLSDLDAAPWRDRAAVFISDEGSRADLDTLLAGYRSGWRAYTCGPDRYMQAVFDAAFANGWPEQAVSREYFSVPEAQDRETLPFTLVLKRSGRRIDVTADQSATDALAAAGVPIVTKCSDGICGVCASPYLSGDVDHRDFVLGSADRKRTILLCCSRAVEAGGEIVLDL